MYRAIAADLDGTLLQNGIRVIDDETITLIKAYTARGGLFLPASGRQYPNLRMMFREAADDIAYVAENGCLVLFEGHIVDRPVMDRKLALDVIDAIRSIPGAKLAVSGVNCTYIVSGDEDFYDHIENYVKTKAVVMERMEDVPEDFSKISAYSRDGVELFDSKLKELFSDRLNVVTSGLYWTDIMPMGVHKGRGVEAISRVSGIPLSDFVALGDHCNDLEMMSIVGHPACVDNAIPEVKALCEKQMEKGTELLKYYLTA